jgi:hypothetical protein
LVDGRTCEIVVVQNHLSLIRLNQTDHDMKSRGLPCAIWTKQADNFTAFDFNIDSVDDATTTVGFCHRRSYKNAHL